MNEKWIKDRFQGLTREELRQAGREIGMGFGPNAGEAMMRQALCAKLGEVGEDALIAAHPQVLPPVPLKRMQRPRLSPGDVWEGRRHRVKIHRSEESKNHKSVVLRWEFTPRSFAYDDTIDMPEPYFFILKNAKIGRIEQEPELDKQGFRIGTINREVFVPRFTFDYYGLTPGTENLPGSILEYWQNEARKNDYFRPFLKSEGQFGRHRLTQIRVDLMGTVKQGFFRDMTNDDIWQEIMQFMGFESIFYEALEGEVA